MLGAEQDIGRRERTEVIVRRPRQGIDPGDKHPWAHVANIGDGQSTVGKRGGSGG